jgi:cell division protease FtsH
MSAKMGPRTFGTKQELVFLGREISEQKDYSDATALEIDHEMDRIINEAYEISTKLLTVNKAVLTALSQTLINKETMDYEDLETLFKDNVAAERLPKKEEYAEMLKPTTTTEEKPPTRTEQ